MVRYLTVPKFAAESGYTPNAIRSKIRDGIWREDLEWKRAPAIKRTDARDSPDDFRRCGPQRLLKRKATSGLFPPTTDT
jgi:hypothetical protein